MKDVTKIAAVLSCVQEIAGNGAFSLGMFADMSKIEVIIVLYNLYCCLVFINLF